MARQGIVHFSTEYTVTACGLRPFDGAEQSVAVTVRERETTCTRCLRKMRRPAKRSPRRRSAA